QMEMLMEQRGGVPSQILLHLRTRASQCIRPELLCDLFGLSPGEAAVAALLAQNHDLASVAILRGVTEQSARTYCKRIFQKTGTRRQAELVALVLNSVANYQAHRP